MFKSNSRPMETWMLYALLSMVFAGVMAIFAKYGLEEIDADLGLVLRTAVIFLMVLMTGWWGNSFADLSKVTMKHVLLLLASGVTAYLSWLCYFRALKDGLVTYVATIDKASIVVTLVLSFILFKEPLKPQVLIGGGLIVAGLFVLVWR